MDPEKKISFVFTNFSKKPATLTKPEVKNVEFVDCFEGQSIKLKNEVKPVVEEPLVIPLRDNKKDLLDRVRDMKAKQKLKNAKTEIEDNRLDSELTVDELAARELIREAKLKLEEKDSEGNKVFVLPVKTDADVPLEGEKEPTIDDYKSVPVSDFGLAMLRGMGWKEGAGIGKKPTNNALLKAPELRPKGLGLGASVLPTNQNKTKTSSDVNSENLVLKKGSFAKIIAGSKNGNYCEVQGFDDEAGRIVVKTTLKGEILALNEFMLVAVTKEEYAKNSKVINNAKFMEYKENEQKRIKNEEVPIKPDKERVSIKKENYSDSEDDKRYKKHKKSKKYSYDSNSDDTSKKIHKRKDKKRHRDKSRSPQRSNYKKSTKSKRNKYTSSDSDSDSDYESKRRRKRYDSDEHRYKKRK